MGRDRERSGIHSKKFHGDRYPEWPPPRKVHCTIALRTWSVFSLHTKWLKKVIEECVAIATLRKSPSDRLKEVLTGTVRVDDIKFWIVMRWILHWTKDFDHNWRIEIGTNQCVWLCPALGRGAQQQNNTNEDTFRDANDFNSETQDGKKWKRMSALGKLKHHILIVIRESFTEICVFWFKLFAVTTPLTITKNVWTALFWGDLVKPWC